ADLLDHPPEFAAMENLIAVSDMKRLRALSTTHFGMATPFVARDREQAMTDLMNDLERYSDAIEEGIAALLRERLARQPRPVAADDTLVWLDSLMVLGTEAETTSSARFLKLHRPAGYQAGMTLVLIGEDGRRLPVITVGGGEKDSNTSQLALFIDGPEPLCDGGYHLYARTQSTLHRNPPLRADAHGLANETLEVRLDGQGGIEGIYLEGVRQAEAGSLMPYVTHGEQTLRAQPASRQAALSADGRSASLHITGPLAGPAGQTLSAGWMDYRLTLLADRPYLLLHGRILYPATEPSGVLKAGMAGLTRRADLGWQEVAPAEIRFAARATPAEPVRVFKRNYLGVESEYSLDYFEFDPRNRDLDNVNNHITAAYVGLAAGDRGMAVAMDTSIQSNFAFAPLKMIYDDASDTFQVRANPFGTYHGRQYRTPTWGNGHGYEVTLRTGEQFASAGPTYNGVAQEFSLLLAFFQGEQMPASLQQELLGFSHPPWVVSLSAPALRRPTAETLRASRSTEIDFAFDAGDRPPRPDVPLGLQLRVLWANLPGLLAHPRL
ncbi:MAG: hypothetical protein WAU91_02065, partial [Desulfatitalea sp.]